MTTMKILALGAGGFIGSHLTAKLLELGHEVAALDIVPEKLEGCRKRAGFTYIDCDITREPERRLRGLIRDADLVIDLIAHANPGIYVKRPLEVFHLNFVENLKIAEICVAEQKRLIQFSSCEVYGKTVASLVPEQLADPDSPDLAFFSEETTPCILGSVQQHRWIYSCGKQLLERVLHAYGLEDRLNYTIIRPFNFIGPQIDFLPSEKEGVPRVFSYFMEALLDSTPMQLVNGGNQKRCYTYIDDAINCITKIVENKNGVCDKQIFNIGTPANEISIKALARLMQDLYVERFGASRDNLPEIVSVSGEEFYGRGYDDSDRRIPDTTKARTLLDWQPEYDIRQTVDMSMAYYV